MARLVVGGVCRFAAHQSIRGVPVINVVDMHIDTESLGDRNAAILDQAKIIAANWVQCFSNGLSAAWQYEKTSWTDLDSEAGDTGETKLAHEGVILPSNGNIAGEASVSNCCYLIKKFVEGGRSARNGRWFLGGLAESGVIENEMATSVASGLNTALPQLLSALNQSGTLIPGLGTSYDSQLVVVHHPAGAPASFTPVNSLGYDMLLATQRERLRGDAGAAASRSWGHARRLFASEGS